MSESSGSQGTGTGEAPRPRGKILIVDDNAVTVTMLEKFLRAKGYAVCSSTDPLQVLDSELPFVPDVVLMDAMMPNLSGFDLTRMLKTGLGGQGIRIIMLTSLRRGEDRQRAAEAGADDFLAKPVEPAKLLETIERHLAESRPDKVIGQLRRILANEDMPAEDQLRAIAGALKAHRLLPE